MPINAETTELFIMYIHAKLFKLCLTLCDPIACSPPQAPVSMGFFRKEYWSELPCPPPPGDLPDLGIEPVSLPSLALAGRLFTVVPPRKPF